MFRLCGYPVGDGRRVRVWGATQYLEIGQTYPQGDGGSMELTWPITSPNWALPDGNDAWAIRLAPPVIDNTTDPLGVSPLGASPKVYDVPASLIYQPDPGGGFGPRYKPPMAGQPPGYGVGSFNLWRGVRYPYQFPWGNTHAEYIGPGILIYWCLLWQGDPATRGARVFPGGYNISALRGEDRFLSQSTAAIYTRVGGSMILQDLPADLRAPPMPGGRTTALDCGALAGLGRPSDLGVAEPELEPGPLPEPSPKGSP